MQLVPNRECGDCNVCCKALLIDESELQKPPGVLCTNWRAGQGCVIYARRPAPCRGFFCGWRLMPELGDELRPDRSGILIRMIREHIPAGLNPVGLYFLLHDRTDVIGPGLADFMTRLVAARTAVYLAVRGPEGFSDGAVLLNEHLAPAAIGGDRHRALAVVRAALDALATNTFAPAVFKHGAPRPPAPRTRPPVVG